MKSSTLLIFLSTLLLGEFASSETLEGQASSLDGSFTYSEIHQIERNTSGQTTKIQTTYFSKDKKKIAFLQSDFGANPYLPNTSFEDFRFKSKFEGKLIEPNSYQIKKTDAEGQATTKTIKTDDTMILGQGFDNFIRWGLLEKKISSKIVNFLVLTRKDFFQFEIKNSSESNSDQQHFHIRPVHFLIRVFAKQIDLFYTKNELILKKYIGLSNLADEKDKHHMVEINYKKISDPSDTKGSNK
jgi:hypothetical protein